MGSVLKGTSSSWPSATKTLAAGGMSTTVLKSRLHCGRHGEVLPKLPLRKHLLSICWEQSHQIVVIHQGLHGLAQLQRAAFTEF